MTTGQVIFVIICAVTVVVHVVLLFYRCWIMQKLGNRQDKQEQAMDKLDQRIEAVEKRLQEGPALYFPSKLKTVK